MKTGLFTGCELPDTFRIVERIIIMQHNWLLCVYVQKSVTMVTCPQTNIHRFKVDCSLNSGLDTFLNFLKQL